MPGKRGTEKGHRSTGEVIDILETVRNDVAFHLGDGGENILDDLIRVLKAGEVPVDEEEPDEDDFV